MGPSDDVVLRVFVVERFLPGLTPDGVREQARREADAAGPGTDLRHLHTTYLVADELCFSVFEAPSLDVMRAANDRSEMSYERICEAVAVTTEVVEAE